MTAPSHETPLSKHRKSLPSIPLLILLLLVVTITAIWTVVPLERMFRVVVTGMLLVLGFLSLEIWFVFFSPYSWKARKRIGIALVVAHLLLFGMFRFKEFSGDIVPTFTFRWVRERDRNLQKLTSVRNSENLPQPAPDFPSRLGPQDFPRFLGPKANGSVETAPLLKTDWKKTPPRELWRQPIGAGWSGFVTAGPYAVTQEQRDTDECITCYEKLTGKVLWSVSHPVRFSEVLGGDGPRATPTIDDGHIYALGATGILSVVDGKTGLLMWSRDTLKEFQQTTLEWAKSSSPLIDDDLVIVSLQAPLKSGAEGTGTTIDLLAAYDRKSGELRWSVKGDKSSYATPRLGEISGLRQIVNVSAQSVTGHDLKDGHEIWRYSWPGAQPKCTDPTLLANDRILLSAGYGLGGVLLQLQKLEDGHWKISELWKSRQLKTRFMNPVIHEGRIFGFDDGILCCVDLQSGKTLWRKGRYGHGQMLLVRDLLLIVAENGDLALVRAAGDAYQELHRRPALNGKTWNTLALSGNLLLIRNAEEAICYELATE